MIRKRICGRGLGSANSPQFIFEAFVGGNRCERASILRFFIIAYDIYDEIPINLLGDALGGKARVMGMIGQLKNNPRIYTRLLQAGYVDADIPSRVARPLVERAPDGDQLPSQGDEHPSTPLTPAEHPSATLRPARGRVTYPAQGQGRGGWGGGGVLGGDEHPSAEKPAGSAGLLDALSKGQPISADEYNALN